MRDFSNLKNLAWLCRMDALTAIYNAQSGHPGGSFSAAELIVGLYFHAMNIDPCELLVLPSPPLRLLKYRAATCLQAPWGRDYP